MGFSLKRALAGAVAGGAKAVSELADLQIKEEAAARLQAQALADKRMLMGEENKLVLEREKRVAEMKKSMLDDERTSIGKMVKEVSSGYKGNDITSPQGQRWMAGEFAKMGRIDLANIYEDNAKNALAEEHSNLNRQTQMQIARLNHLDNQAAVSQRRSEVNDAKEQAALDRKNAKMFDQIKALSDRVGTRDRDGKFIRDDAGFAIGNTVGNFALENLDETHTRSVELAQDAMSKFNSILEQNSRLPKEKRVDSNTLADAFTAQFTDNILNKSNTMRADAFNKSGKIITPMTGIETGILNLGAASPVQAKQW